eukprot:TCONS_00056268-protein
MADLDYFVEDTDGEVMVNPAKNRSKKFVLYSSIFDEETESQSESEEEEVFVKSPTNNRWRRPIVNQVIDECKVSGDNNRCGESSLAEEEQSDDDSFIDDTTVFENEEETHYRYVFL